MICLSLTILLVTLQLSAYSIPTTQAIWTYPSGYDPHGGYVDRITFKIYPSEDSWSAIQDLQVGGVFSYDDELDPFWFDINELVEIAADPDIEMTSETGTSYRQMTLNCQRFPTNLTGYRVALAYALDKHQVVENARHGFAQVMDNPIPLAFEFWSYENQMTSHFYAEDISSANATLEAAHIIDTPDSPHPGWRYYDADMSGNWTQGDKRGDVWAPDGLKIELWVSGWGPAFLAAYAQITGMEKCGLQGEIIEVSYNWLIAGLEYGEYNLGCFRWTINPPGTPTLLYDFFHTMSDDNNFFYRYNNSEYDYNCTQFMQALTRLEARNWAWNCCRILMADMPMIVCYNLENIHMHRTDIWEGYVNQVGVGSMGGNPYTYQSIRLKPEVGGPFGCIPTEYVTILSEGIYSTNTILRPDEYSQTIFNLIYSKLWRIDPLDPMTSSAPDLAYEWAVESTNASGDIQEGMKYTFHLYENITWHDGTPFTSEDVQYSLMNIHKWGTETSENVASIYRIDTPDDYTVEIYSNKSGYITFTQATSVQILPKHIWSFYETENFSWTPESPEDFTGTGCYQWVDYVIEQEIILDRYDEWHFAVEHPERPLCGLNLYFKQILIVAGIGGVIIAIQVLILWALLYRRRKVQAKKGEPTT